MKITCTVKPSEYREEHKLYMMQCTVSWPKKFYSGKYKYKIYVKKISPFTLDEEHLIKRSFPYIFDREMFELYLCRNPQVLDVPMKHNNDKISTTDCEWIFKVMLSYCVYLFGEYDTYHLLNFLDNRDGFGYDEFEVLEDEGLPVLFPFFELFRTKMGYERNDVVYLLHNWYASCVPSLMENKEKLFNFCWDPKLKKKGILLD